MLHTTLKNLRSHLRRLVSTSLSVVLGVAFLAATLLIGDTMRSGFDTSFTQANAGLAVAVRSADRIGNDEVAVQVGTVPLALAHELAAVDGVRTVLPSIEGSGQVIGAEGQRIGGGGPPTLAGNWIDDEGLNPYVLAEGRAPTADDEVVIDRRTATDGDLAVGDTTRVLTPSPEDVTVVGIATFGDRDSLGPTTWVGFTTERAQELFVGSTDRVHELLVAADGIDHEILASQVAPLLDDGLEVLTAEEVTADLLDQIESDFIGFFETTLLAFAGIALLVATFSIHNTFSILVAQRTRESALLRAIGASRSQVLAAVAVEALLVGLIASAIGAAVGVGLAALALAAMDSAGFGLGLGLVVGTRPLLVAGVIGAVVTLIASLSPAIAASRVAPLAAIREVAIERTAPSRVRIASGLLVLVGSVLLFVTAPSAGDGALGRAALGGAGILIGTIVVGPLVAGRVASVIGAPIAALRGQSGVLARRNAIRNPRRTAGTASALVLGVAVVALFTVLAGSITSMVDDVVDQSFAGDLVVASSDFSGATLSSSLGDAIDELPEVERAVGISNAVLRHGDETWYAAATDPSRLESILDIQVTAGDLATTDTSSLLLSSNRAESEGLTIGDVVAVDMVDGTVEELRVDALYEEAQIMGDMIVHRDMWARHTPQLGDVVVLIGGTDGVAIDDLRSAVGEVTDRFFAPAPQDRDEYVDTIAAEIDAVLVMVYGLLAIAVLIALMGIANTISLSIHERTRELGLLRAVGQTRRQLRSMVRGESVIVAVYGTLTGVVLGVVLGWGLLRALSEVEGVVTPLSIPAVPLLVVVGIGAVAGVAAAWRPARRASRMDVLTAIATD